MENIGSILSSRASVQAFSIEPGHDRRLFGVAEDRGERRVDYRQRWPSTWGRDQILAGVGE
jgi:hypothetical protein